MRAIFSILSCLLFALLTQGQKTVFIAIHTGEFTNDSTEKLIGQILPFPDSNAVINHLEDLRSSDFSEGYLYAHYSFLRPWSNDSPYVVYARGDKVFIRSLSSGNADRTMLRTIGYSEKRIAKWQHADPAQILSWQTKMIIFYENNGYPFATVQFKIDSLQNDSITASWNVEKGPLISIDSVVHKGRYQPPISFTKAWLGLQQGQLYNEKRLRRSWQRIKMSEIVEEEKPPQLFFSEGKVRIDLFLKRKKASRFDGILGFAPEAASSGKLLFTGDVNLRLANSFNQGDDLMLRWKSSAGSSQEISIKASIPFLFGLPVGVNGAIDIYRKDSTYIRTRQRYGLLFSAGIGGRGSLFAETTENRVLNEEIFEQSSGLPSQADSRTTAAGVSLYMPWANHSYMPTKGIIAEAEISAGRKKILSGNALTDSLFSTIEKENSFVTGQSQIQAYFPLSKRLGMAGTTQVGFMETSNIFTNDLFLIGGLSLMRGFDEKSIEASRYVVSSAELRFFPERFSYLVVFADYGMVQVKTNAASSNHYYLSTGAGLIFSTGSGIFNLYYALGKSNPGMFNLRNGKIHFGFTTRF